MIPKWKHYFLLFVKEISQTKRHESLKMKMDKEFSIRTFYFQTKWSIHRFCAFFMLELVFHISGIRSVYDYLFFCCHLALFQAFSFGRSISFMKYFRLGSQGPFQLTTSYLTLFLDSSWTYLFNSFNVNRQENGISNIYRVAQQKKFCFAVGGKGFCVRQNFFIKPENQAQLQ